MKLELLTFSFSSGRYEAGDALSRFPQIGMKLTSRFPQVGMKFDILTLLFPSGRYEAGVSHPPVSLRSV